MKAEHKYAQVLRWIADGETVEPSFGTKYYAADPYSTVFFSDDKWSGWPEHHEWLRRGLVHLTKENAIAHAKAMLGID